jgi:septum formation protein
MVQPQIVLASASPRRAQLLSAIGIRFRVVPAAIDERALPGESAVTMAERLAVAKAAAVAGSAAPLPVLAADTVVVVDDQMLGKPADRAAGIAMLQQLAGRTHTVVTVIAVAVPGRTEARRSVTQVTFRNIDRAEAAAYWDTGEPVDKAGGYGIQGIGGIFAEHIEGSYSGVVGLPIAETEALLRAFGVNTWRYRGA